jgi:hypothetical protein
MAAAMTAADALALAQRGHAVFPADGKIPRVRWKDEATTDVNTITAWWKRWPDATIGLALAPNQMVVDIDDLEAVKASGLEFVDTAGQLTPSGGFHFFYRTDGRPVPQVVKRNGLDTRVGGKGYVIAWDPGVIPVASEWGMAPEWVYEKTEKPKPEPGDNTPLGTHDEIRDLLISPLAVQHPDWRAADFLAILRARLADGRIESRDPAEPWTDRDLQTFAEWGEKWATQGPDWWAEWDEIVGFRITWETAPQLQAFIDWAMTGLLSKQGAVVKDGRLVSWNKATTLDSKGREIVLTSAASIPARRVHWLYDGRLAMGSFSLLGGREGQGKTLYSNELAAEVTRGTLPGEYLGNPRSVIIVTTEDSWEHTIVPRLMAANADRTRVFRAEVRTADEYLAGLSLPRDFGELERSIRENDVALVIFDPLLSRLDSGLDSHKDAEVRLALEPLVAIAQRTGVHIMGLIHVNKTATTDPLTSLMASRAFAAVARSVLYVMKDPEDQGVRLIGQPKNTMGRTDFPTLRFEVEAVEVGRDPEDGKPIIAPRMKWLDSTERTVEDALFTVGQPHKRSKADEAGDWLLRYLRACPDYKAKRADIVAGGAPQGHTEDHLRRARENLSLDVVNEGFPKVTYWQLPLRLMPESDVGQPATQ